MMAEVVQINLNHCTVIHDLLPKLIREEKVDIVIISEQLRDQNDPNWLRDSTNTADIWVCRELHISKKMDVLLPKLTCLEVASIRLYSCYLLPSDSIEEFEKCLDAIVASAKNFTLPVVIAGDFNAWAIEWESRKMNRRSHALLESFAILELVIANIETGPTYTKERKSSIVDLTFVDPRLSREGSYWQISDRYTGSDHRALTYQLHPTN